MTPEEEEIDMLRAALRRARESVRELEMEKKRLLLEIEAKDLLIRRLEAPAGALA